MWPEDRYPKRKSPRLAGYDYSQAGAYFVTICTHRHSHLFGHVADEIMILNDLGSVADECWLAIPTHFPQLILDVHVVMPNHVHGILCLDDDLVQRPPNLGMVIGAYKGTVTRLARQRFPNLNRPLWQRSFHDHIIRNEHGYRQIYDYVLQNPARWHADRYYQDDV